MSRSSKKKPFVEEKLLKRVEAMNETGKKEVLKTWSRASILFKSFSWTKGFFLLDLDI